LLCLGLYIWHRGAYLQKDNTVERLGAAVSISCFLFRMSRFQPHSEIRLYWCNLRGYTHLLQTKNLTRTLHSAIKLTEFSHVNNNIRRIRKTPGSNLSPRQNSMCKISVVFLSHFRHMPDVYRDLDIRCFFPCAFHSTTKNSVVLVRERTIPTERPPLFCKISANICG
jgi:hypothetical protein